MTSRSTTWAPSSTTRGGRPASPTTLKAGSSTSWPSLSSARDLPLVAAPLAAYEISAGRTSGRRSHGPKWPVTRMTCGTRHASTQTQWGLP